MQYRTLGRTGAQLSVIGFGGIVVNGGSPAEADQRVARAVERGVTYFDVAPSYGNGEAEELKAFETAGFLGSDYGPFRVPDPSQAVQTGQDGPFVFVVTEKETAEQRPVTTGQRVGDDMVVQSGVMPGERVVTEGQLRLEQGTRVQLADANGAPAGGRNGRGGRGRRGSAQ